MKQPLFPSAIGTQSRFAYFLTVKAVVRKFGKSDVQTGSRCLDKAVLAQRGGGGTQKSQINMVRPCAYCGLDKAAACARHIQLPAHTPSPRKVNIMHPKIRALWVQVGKQSQQMSP